jgi:hypothetical protein
MENTQESQENHRHIETPKNVAKLVTGLGQDVYTAVTAPVVKKTGKAIWSGLGTAIKVTRNGVGAALTGVGGVIKVDKDPKHVAADEEPSFLDRLNQEATVRLTELREETAKA